MTHHLFSISPGHRDGRFQPNSFDHLLQTAVMAPGLDPGYEHRLIDVQVAKDGRSADVTVHSTPVARTRQLGRAFRVVNGTPTAKVRCVSHENPAEVLAELQLDAPLQPGQRVAFGEDEYLVVRDEWPHRDPDTGVCAGGFDWQHAYLSPVEPVGTLVQQAALYAPPPAAPPLAPDPA